MDLFLNNSHESFLLELLVNLLKLQEQKTVIPLRLSKASIKLYEEGVLKLPGLPSLITKEGKILNTAAGISVFLIKTAFCEEILLGNTAEVYLNIFIENSNMFYRT